MPRHSKEHTLELDGRSYSTHIGHTPQAGHILKGLNRAA